MLKHQEVLATRMAAHLKLTGDTIDGSAMLAGAMLSTDARQAQAAAIKFHEVVVRTHGKEAR